MKAISIFTLLAVALAAAACGTVEGTEIKPPRPVKTMAVTAADAAPAIRYSATIEAFEQVPLSFKASGYVDEVQRRRGADGRMRAAQPGDAIARGTVLARVREGDYRERVNQARARVADAEVARGKARLDLDRARILFESASLIKPDLDAAQSAFDSAETRVASAQADLELALIALRDTALFAPASGVLLERRIEQGALVSGGTVGFVLGDISAVKARFGIPDAMIQAVTLGEEIDVTVEALNGAAFAGRITGVAPAADPQSRVFDVEITVPNADGRLRPGMIGTVALGPAAARGAQAAAAVLTVPLTAVVRAAPGSDEYAVFVAETQGTSEIARRRTVTLGEVLGNGIAVRRGIALGERVVVSGATLLVDGEAVRPIP
jgi:multidrug efflux system membrane fusion protein